MISDRLKIKRQALRIAELEHDCQMLALRLLYESPHTMAEGTESALDRWRPRCEQLLRRAEHECINERA